MNALKSKEYVHSSETSHEISNEDFKKVEQLKDYYSKASEKEKQRLNNEFTDNVQKEVNKDQNLKAALDGKNIDLKNIKDDFEITKDDFDNITYLTDLRASLDAYPNIPNSAREAINNMVYGTLNGYTEEIAEVLSKNEKSEA